MSTGELFAMSNKVLTSNKVDLTTEARRARPTSQRDALKPPNTVRPRRARGLATLTRPNWLRPSGDLLVVFVFAAAAIIFGVSAVVAPHPWPFVLCALTASAAVLYASYHHGRSLNGEVAKTHPQ